MSLRPDAWRISRATSRARDVAPVRPAVMQRWMSSRAFSSFFSSSFRRAANHSNEYWSLFSQKKCTFSSFDGRLPVSRRTRLSRTAAKGVTPMPAPMNTAWRELSMCALGEP